MTPSKARPRTKTARFELRQSAKIAHDLDAAATALGVSKSQFAGDAASEKALKVLARGDRTLMDPQTFDHMMAEHLTDATPYKVL